MNEEFTKTRTCAQATVRLRSGPDDKFCSLQCEAMEVTPDLYRDCLHAGCKGRAVAQWLGGSCDQF
jgi:hypothetical protein